MVLLRIKRVGLSTSTVSSSSSSSASSGSSRFSAKARSSLSLQSSGFQSKAAQDVLDNALSTDQVKRMWGSVERYTGWCREQKGFAEDRIWSPSESDIIDYLSSTMAGRVSAHTAKRHVRLIKFYFHSRGYHWPGGENLKICIKGIKRMTPPSSTQNRKVPVSEDMLFDLRDGLELSFGKDNLPINPLHVAVFAAVLVAWWSQLRLGEILPPSCRVSSYDRLIHPIIDDVTPDAKASSLRLFLPSTKTETSRGETVLIPRQNGHPLDPCTALYYHTSCYDSNALPLFAYFDNDLGIIRCLTKEKFLEVCNSILQPKGHPRITGHSFRVGGTCFMLKSGVNPHMVKGSGRWKSDAFHAYWRDAATLSSSHLENLASTSMDSGRGSA